MVIRTWIVVKRPFLVSENNEISQSLKNYNSGNFGRRNGIFLMTQQYVTKHDLYFRALRLHR